MNTLPGQSRGTADDAEKTLLLGRIGSGLRSNQSQNPRGAQTIVEGRSTAARDLRRKPHFTKMLGIPCKASISAVPRHVQYVPWRRHI